MGKYKIISEGDGVFQSREQAGRMLADALKTLKGAHPLVLGIPRGGLIAAREIAHALEGELDVVLAHKIGAPQNPELAIGAVVEGGKVFLDQEILPHLGADENFLKQEEAVQMKVLKERAKIYREIRPKVPAKDRVVIITDDGAARGLTMQAALWAIRHEAPKKLISALPCAPPDTVIKLSHYADEVVCLRAPEYFMALGQFYSDFDQVSDDEVRAILKEEAARKK